MQPFLQQHIPRYGPIVKNVSKHIEVSLQVTMNMPATVCAQTTFACLPFVLDLVVQAALVDSIDATMYKNDQLYAAMLTQAANQGTTRYHAHAK